MSRLPQVFSFALAIILSSCATFQIPKGYVPDSKVVYLTQNTGFNPISYKGVPADPYVFTAEKTPVNAEKPAFLHNANWDNLLVPDFQADSRLYNEVEAHFLYILNLPLIKELRTTLDSADVKLTPPLTPDVGDKLTTYTNGGVFNYPAVPNATIKVLDGGYYEINFPDKSFFRHYEDGTYERTDAAGQIVFASYPKTSQIITTIDGITYTVGPNFREMKGPQGSLSYSAKPDPQYHFTPPNDASAPEYTLFVDDQKDVKAITITLSNGLRIDYFTKEMGLQRVGVSVTNGGQAIFIDSQYRKVHMAFDTATRTATKLLSVYLPEGLRLTNFMGTDPAYGELKSAWPEQYKIKAMGPFDILYTSKDEALVSKLRPDRVTAIEASDRQMTGLAASHRRTMVIPPDLDSYRKLYVSKPGQVLNWYPSGFETQDLIVMWPISVPRYDAPQGQDYFFNQEFYEILTHEYVHILVGENTGIASPVPAWLNEGLAVFVESHFSKEVKDYWDLTFEVSRGLKRLLDWDLVTTTSTGELEVSKARIEYAQSYALVSALEQKFGAAKVAEYIRSFRLGPEDSYKTDLKATYKGHFKTVFGVDFEQALKLLDPPKEKT